MTRTRLRISALVALLALARPAAADEASPGELFQRAQAAYSAKRFKEAGELFEQAFQVSPTAQAAYNAGIAWDKADVRARAANMLTRAINVGELSHGEVREASRRLSALVPTLGKIELVSPKGAPVRIGDSEVTIPSAVYVEPGTHVVEAKLADGSSRRETVVLGAGESRSLTFESRAEVPAKHESAPPLIEPDRSPATPSTGSGPPRWLGYVSLGVAAAAVGTGVYLNVRGRSENDKFDQSDRTDLGARKSAVNLRTAAFVAYGAGAVFGGVGVYLILSSKDSAPPQVAYRLRF